MTAQLWSGIQFLQDLAKQYPHNFFGLVELSAEALKIAAGVIFHLPGGLVAKGIITAGQRMLKQELNKVTKVMQH